MAGRADEVQASVHTEIDLVLPARLLLLEHVGLMLVVEKLDDGHPRIAVVDIVAETGCVDHCQADYMAVRNKRLRHGMQRVPSLPLKNFSSSSALVISISTVLSTCFWCRRLWSA